MVPIIRCIIMEMMRKDKRLNADIHWKGLLSSGLDREVQKSLLGQLNPKWIKSPRPYHKIMFLAEFGFWSSV